MKKTYHLCLSAGEEAMFRDLEDYHRGFNSFALALSKTSSTGLAEAIMATHMHQLVQTDQPSDFMHSFRQSYGVYFNNKYQRTGRLGENVHFTMEVVGYHHLLAAIVYVMRNPLHHGVVPIPYAYPHCSANAIYRQELGKFYTEALLPSRNYSQFIGRRAEVPSVYKMTKSGVFLRESVLDVPQVENLFVTPRAFNYYMTRKSSEEWEKEQAKDGNGLPPVNLHSIEPGATDMDLDNMLIFENGKGDYRKLTDIELCTRLDQLARTRYGKHSVYQLSIKEKQSIAEDLYRKLRLSEAQIRRCLVL